MTRGGEGGQKIPKTCWRNIWMVPYVACRISVFVILLSHLPNTITVIYIGVSRNCSNKISTFLRSFASNKLKSTSLFRGHNSLGSCTLGGLYSSLVKTILKKESWFSFTHESSRKFSPFLSQYTKHWLRALHYWVKSFIKELFYKTLAQVQYNVLAPDSDSKIEGSLY